jgi:hypothetical protein
MPVMFSALQAGRHLPPPPPEIFLVLIWVRGWFDLRAIVRLEGLGKLKNSNGLIGNRTRHLPTCSIVNQPTTLPRASPLHLTYLENSGTQVVRLRYRGWIKYHYRFPVNLTSNLKTCIFNVFKILMGTKLQTTKPEWPTRRSEKTRDRSFINRLWGWQVEGPSTEDVQQRAFVLVVLALLVLQSEISSCYKTGCSNENMVPYSQS